jgi:hypothetical protein
MTLNAARPGTRTTRRGDTHLTLVTVDTRDTATEDDTERQRGKHAAPATRLPVAGSATVRALMALGALLSAVGFSFGKAEAVLSHQGQDQQPTEADSVLPTDSRSVLVATGTAAPAATEERSAPGHWAPAITTAKVRVFKLSTPITGTGRHRRPAATDGWGERNPDTWRPTGRHRKLVTAPQHSRPGSTRRTVIARASHSDLT